MTAAGVWRRSSDQFGTLPCPAPRRRLTDCIRLRPRAGAGAAGQVGRGRALKTCAAGAADTDLHPRLFCSYNWRTKREREENEPRKKKGGKRAKFTLSRRRHSQRWPVAARQKRFKGSSPLKLTSLSSHGPRPRERWELRPQITHGETGRNFQVRSSETDACQVQVNHDRTKRCAL